MFSLHLWLLYLRYYQVNCREQHTSTKLPYFNKVPLLTLIIVKNEAILIRKCRIKGKLSYIGYSMFSPVNVN